MRAGNGNISATKLNASVGAYNDYVRALVGEIGPDRALNEAPSGQKALYSLLGQLLQVANQSSPTAPAPMAPSTPPASGTPDAAPRSTPDAPAPTTPPLPR